MACGPNQVSIKAHCRRSRKRRVYADDETVSMAPRPIKRKNKKAPKKPKRMSKKAMQQLLNSGFASALLPN